MAVSQPTSSPQVDNMKTVLLVLCLFGSTLAAEKDSSRKSRQILHPLVPVLSDPHTLSHSPHGLLNYVQQSHLLPSPTPYFQSAVPIVLPHPPPAAFHTNSFHRSIGLHGIQQVQLNPANVPLITQQTYSGSYDPSQNQAYRGQSYFSSGNQQGQDQQGRDQSSGNNENRQSGQFESYSFSSRPQSQSLSPLGSQPFNNQAQDSGNQQNYRFNAPSLNQNGQRNNQPYRFEVPSSQNEQRNQPNSDPSQQSGPSPYRPSPRFFNPSSVQAEDQSNSNDNNSGNIQNNARTNQGFRRPSNQQAFSIFRRNDFQVQNGQQSRSQQSPNGVSQVTPILSQSGEINNDGSYSYGFLSANGIQSAESGAMRYPGQLRIVQGSYSYVAPDGTPISAQYYADDTGFHIQGDHIPTAASVSADVSRNSQDGRSLGFQQQRPQQSQAAPVIQSK